MTDINLRDNDFDEFNKRLNRKRVPIKIRPRRKRKKVKASIYEYIARKVPADAHLMLNKFGKYRRARNSKELEYQLKDFSKTFGDKGLKELAKIHPDRILIESECRNCKEKDKAYFTPPPPPPPPPTPQIVYANAIGDSDDKKRHDTTNTMIMGGFVLLAIAIIMKEKK